MMLRRAFATVSERGYAAYIREKYRVPREMKDILNQIIHEKNDKPTKLRIPKEVEEKTWKVNRGWCR